MSSEAPEIAWLEIADSPQLWRDLGYRVDDNGICFIGGVQHRLIGTDSEHNGLARWAITGLDSVNSSIDGLPTVFPAGYEAATSAPPLPHLNQVSSIDHIVIRTPSTPRTAAALEAAGLERRGHSDSTSAGETVDMTFFWIGKTLLEVVGPPVPKPGDKPASFMGVAYVSADLDKTSEYLGELCSTPKDAVQPGRRIAALRSEAGSTMPMAFMTPHVKASSA